MIIDMSDNQIDDPIVFSFKQEMRLSIWTKNDETKAMKALNLAWIGKKNCNKLVDGKFVSDIDDPKLEEQLVKAHTNVRRTQPVQIMVHVHKSGKLTCSLD